MATTERTYSFEGPTELEDRLARVRSVLSKLATAAPDVEAWTAREVEMGLARLRRDAPELAADSATFMRASVELVVNALEKVADGLAHSDDLRAWEREDIEGDAFRRGALRASAPVWRDE